MNTKLISTALAAATLFTLSGGASAQQAAEVEVTFYDLDLSSDRGVDILDHRIERAVRRVCGDTALRADFNRSATRRCITQTRDDVQPVREEVIAEARSGDAARMARATLIVRTSPG
ncbi:UrcA family protein [Aurantiacibacter marinus]|uniref:UrcA family protein n=1 Tax=Aurantiacibacter marinus TaxID=874156 RepID=A0A0H0XTG0_9SPHN|nr:UrcA family protein [Aurantiacibacter marinus]KLI63580.1 hypothetical protein AAV99_07415 [Aurantiacibacter marinus]